MANYFYQNPWEDAANIVSGLLQRQTRGNTQQMQAQAAVLGELLRAQQQEKQLGFEGQRTTAQVGADTARAGLYNEQAAGALAEREGLGRIGAGMETGNMAQILGSLPFAQNASTLMQGYSRGRGLEQTMPLAQTNPMVALALALDSAQVAQPYSTSAGAVTDNPVTGTRSENPVGFNIPANSLRMQPDGTQLQGILDVAPGHEMRVPGGAGVSNQPIVNPRMPTPSGTPPEEMRKREFNDYVAQALIGFGGGLSGQTNQVAESLINRYKKITGNDPLAQPVQQAPQPIIFHNPQTGEKIQLINGQWVPIP